MTRAFIIRGFGKKKDSKGTEYDFDRVQTDLIDPALRACDLVGGTTATQEDAGNIREDMFAMILAADVVICDITIHNANVFYELGVRHALRKRHTLLLRGEGSGDTTPFDLSTDRYLTYDSTAPGRTLDALVRALQSTLRTTRDTDSPIFLLLPTLTQQDTRGVAVVPLDLIGEIGQAESAKDMALLRVIAEDVRGLRCERDALRRLAAAQWSLKDLDAAQAAWESVRKDDDSDVDACLALSSIYERQYRVTRRETLLAASNQAIERVLADPRLEDSDRAEALSLQGRNAKTLWRARFETPTVTDPKEARRLAIDARALDAWASYRRAFETDLNRCYPGIAALQMGTILRSLAEMPAWPNLFKGDKRLAQRTREDLDADLLALRHVVEASVRRATARATGEERMWANITGADLLFLTMPDEEWQADPSAIVQAYHDAVPEERRWAFDATRDQLLLFERLDIRAAAARAVIDSMVAEPVPRTHLVMFCGHGIDRPGAPRRFPAEAEPKARALITEALQALKASVPADETLMLLASGAPGADLLAHEVARELGIARRLCLPMPAQDVSRLAYADLPAWRARFLDLVREMDGKKTRQMSDHAELPRWLQGSGQDVWSRGNRWALKLAQTWDAGRVTVLALWDGQDDGRDGGTAQMVRLAREVGAFVIQPIDARALLA